MNGLYFSHHIGNFIIPTDFHSMIFQRVGSTTSQWYIGMELISPKNADSLFFCHQRRCFRRDDCWGFTSKGCDLLWFNQDKWWFTQGYHVQKLKYRGTWVLKKVVWWCLMWFSGDFMGISVFFLMDDHNPDAQCYDGLASNNSWHHQWVCPVLLVPVRTRFNFTHCTVIWTSTINQS